MEQIKKFLRSRGFALALLACLVAAAAAGVWAVRTVRDELKKRNAVLTYEEDKGGHDWDFWDKYIPKMLDFLFKM